MSTYTSTYSVSDIELVMRRFHADLLMIAETSATLGKDRVKTYVEDIAALAKAGYLAWVDVTLLSYGIEKRAVRYEVNTNASDLTPNRPGDVIWPRLPSPRLRIVISYSAAWWTLSADEQAAFRKRLNVPWAPSYEDMSHASLRSNGSRDYVSNGYGLSRKDYSQ